MNINLLKKVIGFCVFIFLFSLSFSPAVNAQFEESVNPSDKTIDLNCGYDIVSLLNDFNESLNNDYLSDLLDFAPRYTGTKNCDDAADFIYTEFKKLGLDISIDPWRHIRYKSQNVVATLNGSDPGSDAVFVVCAHYDTVEDSPGANDDGTGVAMLLTLANILSNISFNHTIKFIAFSAEELGMWGSQNYAYNAYYKNENIIVTINLDTLGYTETEKGGKFVQMLCPERNLWVSSFFENIAETYNEYIDLEIEVLPNHPCDHDSFTQVGYDAMMLMQYDDLVYVHGPDDTLDHINFSYLNKITKLVLAALVTIADKPIDLQVRIVSPLEGSFYLFDKHVYKHPAFYRSRARFGRTYILGSCIVRINITADEEIDKIIYCVDDFHQLVYKTDFYPDETIEWRLRGYDSALIGKHKLGVYVYTVSGKVAYDEMDITTLTMNRYYW